MNALRILLAALVPPVLAGVLGTVVWLATPDTPTPTVVVSMVCGMTSLPLWAWVWHVERRAQREEITLMWTEPPD